MDQLVIPQYPNITCLFLLKIDPFKLFHSIFLSNRSDTPLDSLYFIFVGHCFCYTYERHSRGSIKIGQPVFVLRSF